MNGCTANEISCLQILLGLKLTSGLKWKLYLRTVVEAAGKVDDSMYHFQKVFYFSKHALNLQNYVCHIRAGMFSLHFPASIDLNKKRLHSIVDKWLFSIPQLLSLHEKLLASLNSIFMADVQTIDKPTHLGPAILHTLMFTYLCIPLVRRKIRSDSFFPRTATLWKRHTKEPSLIITILISSNLELTITIHIPWLCTS